MAAETARDYVRASSQYFDITDAAGPNLNFGGGNTIAYTCGWINADDTGTQYMLWGKQLDNTGTGYQWDMRLQADKTIMFLKGYSTSSYTTPATTDVITAGTWHFVEGFNDGTNMGVCLDRGTDVTIADTNTWRSSAGKFWLGTRAGSGGPDSNGYFNGLMQCVVVVTGTMPSTAQRDALYASGAGVCWDNRPSISGTYQGWWNQFEASGNAIDESANGYDLTDRNSVGSGTGHVECAAAGGGPPLGSANLLGVGR